MPISASISSAVDIRLPATPEQVDDVKTYRELLIVYAAIRSLHQALTGVTASGSIPTLHDSLSGLSSSVLGEYNHLSAAEIGKLLGIEAGAEVNNISDINATDLTDGGATTLHKHDHGGMDGLGDDDHTQYILVTNLEVDRATIVTNWDDLTDAGATSLHKHDHAAQDNLNSANYTHLTAINALDLTDGGVTALHTHDFDHSALSGLDGGTIGEYYHLTAAEYAARTPITITTTAVSYSPAYTGGTITVLCDTTTNSITVNLPTAIGNIATYTIKKTAAANTLTVDASGTETIDGALTAAWTWLDESITLISDNANWRII